MGQASSQPTAAAVEERQREVRGAGDGGGGGRRRSIFRQTLRHSAISPVPADEDEGEDGLLRQEHSTSTPRPRPRPRGRSGRQSRTSSVYRLSQLLRPGTGTGTGPATGTSGAAPADGEMSASGPDSSDTSRRAGLHRTASRFRDALQLPRRRAPSSRHPLPISRPSLLNPPPSLARPGMNHDRDSRADYYSPPRLPSIDLTSTFDHEPFAPDSADQPDHPPPSSHSNRRSSLRLSALRPDRPFRHFGSSLRRRRSPQPSIRRGGNEDQATMLSRLLSVAAAATAATLMGDDHQALSEARSLTGSAMGDLGSGGEDGSFDGFLRALQNGRIASALRQSSDGESESGSRGEGPLNFFRMFRFGASENGNSASPINPASGDSGESGDHNSGGRMVPIIIVGIRSINPNSSSAAGSADDLPPFIDALGNFPSPLPATSLGEHGHDSIDSILRPPQNGTSFRHRRRASMGGFGMGRNRISDRLDDQRDHRSPDRRRQRPWSMASTTSNPEPRPPPATPASPSPELSRISSRSSTPAHSRPASLVANSLRDFGSDSRRNSTLPRAAAAGSPLSAHTEETASVHSTHSATNLLSSSPPPNGDASRPFRHSHRRSDTAPNIHYPRFASGHPRRNGVVEPDHLPPLSRTSTANTTSTSAPHPRAPGRHSSEHEARSSRTGSRSTSRSSSTATAPAAPAPDSRSWIIYVLGGSYPESHPILTTPSLFTENPTYEDMLLLSALLGPAKPPVASDEDVERAGGVYTVEEAGAAPAPAPEPEPSQRQAGADEGVGGHGGGGKGGPPTIGERRELVAVAVAAGGSEEVVRLEAGQRCLVCLCEYAPREAARKLGRCGHLFHRECIDQWLTQGRNSCPLCRGQGVDEKAKPVTAAAADDDEDGTATVDVDVDVDGRLPGSRSADDDVVATAAAREAGLELELEAARAGTGAGYAS